MIYLSKYLGGSSTTAYIAFFRIFLCLQYGRFWSGSRSVIKFSIHKPMSIYQYQLLRHCLLSGAIYESRYTKLSHTAVQFRNLLQIRKCHFCRHSIYFRRSLVCLRPLVCSIRFSLSSIFSMRSCFVLFLSFHIRLKERCVQHNFCVPHYPSISSFLRFLHSLPFLLPSNTWNSY